MNLGGILDPHIGRQKVVGYFCWNFIELEVFPVFMALYFKDLRMGEDDSLGFSVALFIGFMFLYVLGRTFYLW